MEILVFIIQSPEVLVHVQMAKYSYNQKLNKHNPVLNLERGYACLSL